MEPPPRARDAWNVEHQRKGVWYTTVGCRLHARWRLDTPGEPGRALARQNRGASALLRLAVQCDADSRESTSGTESPSKKGLDYAPRGWVTAGTRDWPMTAASMNWPLNP